jgi:ATP-dependent DNA helicase RecG
MTPNELRERILRWEGPHTNFKRELGNTGDLARDLVCFANSDGGQLIIGIDGGRNVIGVPDTDDLMLKVDDVAFNRCSPPITVVPEIVDLDGSAVVVLNIPRAINGPIGLSTAGTTYGRGLVAVVLAVRNC